MDSAAGHTRRSYGLNLQLYRDSRFPIPIVYHTGIHRWRLSTWCPTPPPTTPLLPFSPFCAIVRIPLNPAALAFVPFGIVLVRVRVRVHACTRAVPTVVKICCISSEMSVRSSCPARNVPRNVPTVPRYRKLVRNSVPRQWYHREKWNLYLRNWNQHWT